LLIIAVLLHVAKGEGLGSIGSPARVFGSQKDMEKGLNKFTGIIAFLFMLLALVLSLFFK
ncbi:MAG: preprotein translocase subunit SecG, partial [Candidatus Margulisiibacteriota bacterium]